MAKAMEQAKHGLVLALSVVLVTALLLFQANATHPKFSQAQTMEFRPQRKILPKEYDDLRAKRMLIGSTAPTCTYNECRGCKYRCRAEQIPVDGNDPVHSAYRYKCVCQRH